MAVLRMRKEPQVEAKWLARGNRMILRQIAPSDRCAHLRRSHRLLPRVCYRIRRLKLFELKCVIKLSD